MPSLPSGRAGPGARGRAGRSRAGLGRCLCRAWRAGLPGRRCREEEGVRGAQGAQVSNRCQGGGQEGGQGGGLLVQCPALRTVKSQKQ